jgi:outer membrane lipoprotein-sorting protein
MKKIFITLIVSGLFLAGCQQAQDMQKNATATLDEASKQVESAKASVIDAKNKLDEKVTQVQDAAAAINKLGQ